MVSVSRSRPAENTTIIPAGLPALELPRLGPLPALPHALTRAEFLASLLAAGGLAPRSARANGLDQMMWDYMSGYLQRLDQNRRREFAKLSTSADLDALRAKVRNKLLEMWGPLPAEKTPLHPRHIATIDRSDYVIEKIIYESRPRFYVTANLYRPKGRSGSLPAVIFPPGHAAEGKAYPAYQKFCIVMARSGFVVLNWDPVGQGERVQLWDRTRNRPLVGAGSREHTVLGRQCYLLGLNLMGYRAWDAVRAIDYLESRSDVDPERIGMAGNSGGGMETLQFAPYEPRVKVAVPMCAVASFRAKTEALLIADPEQILYGTLRHGIDHPELLAALAPRPVLIGSAARDYVPIESARETFRAVSGFYQRLGLPDKAAIVVTDDTHGLNKQLRDASASWLARWLGAGPPSTQDPEADVLPEADLRCTETGQVAALPDATTVLTLNQDYARKTAPRRAVPSTADEFQIFRTEVARQVQFVTQAGSFKPEAGIHVPDRVFDPASFARGDALVVSDRGRDEPLLRRSVIDPLITAGYRVASLDLRGWGESEPRMPQFDVKFSWDDFFAYRSLEIGRSLLGQRVKDLLSVAPRRTTHRRWLVVGVGAAALVALHAAVIEPRITRLVTVGGLLSYRSLIDDPLTTQPFSSFLPGVIPAYDLKDLYAALAPRNVLVVNPMNSRRKPAGRVKAWEELDWTAQTYERMNATDSFRLETQVSSLKMRALLGDWAKTSL